MIKNPDTLRFIANLLPDALKAGTAHRTLVAFNAGALMGYLGTVQSRNKRALDEGALATLVPALVTPLKRHEDSISSDLLRDAILGTYVLLSALSRVCTLAPTAVGVILAAAATSASLVPNIAPRFLRAAIAFVNAQDPVDEWSKKTSSALLSVPDLGKAIQPVLSLEGVENLLSPLLSAMVEHKSGDRLGVVRSLIMSTETPEVILRKLTPMLVARVLEDKDYKESNSYYQNLRLLEQRHPSMVDSAIEALGKDSPTAVENLIESLTKSEITPSESTENGAVAASFHAKSSVRVKAVRNLFETLGSSDELESDKKVCSFTRACLRYVIVASECDPSRARCPS
jgi:U3 small nucleolar RNA-associated protein 10